MRRLLFRIDRRWLKAVWAGVFATALGAMIFARMPVSRNGTDSSLCNADFPNTYIRSIHIDLTGPDHWVRLAWSGPKAIEQETGPFHSSPGAGLGDNDCDDVVESNRDGSNCTPKGRMLVEGFSDHIPSYPSCKFVTWFQRLRTIGFHSHWEIPAYPASHGCVRLSEHAAQLIHNNAIIGKTEVIVDGTWTRPPTAGGEFTL
ncbi:MAG: L,D-transpeptidase [Pirellulales bacterium]